VGYIAYWWVI